MEVRRKKTKAPQIKKYTILYCHFERSEKSYSNSGQGANEIAAKILEFESKFLDTIGANFEIRE